MHELLLLLRRQGFDHGGEQSLRGWSCWETLANVLTAVALGMAVENFVWVLLKESVAVVILNHLTLVHDDDLIREGDGGLEPVGNHHHCGSSACSLIIERLEDLLLRLEVKLCCWLIEQE